MNQFEGFADSGSSQPTWSRVLWRLAALLMLGQIVFSVVTYPFLPAQVPSHWDAAGQVNGYMPPLAFVLIFVGISLFLFLVLSFIGVVVRAVDRPGCGAAISSVVAFLPVAISLVTQIIVTGVVLHW